MVLIPTGFAFEALVFWAIGEEPLPSWAVAVLVVVWLASPVLMASGLILRRPRPLAPPPAPG